MNNLEIEQDNELRTIIATVISCCKVADKITKAQFGELEGEMSSAITKYINKNKPIYYNQMRFECYRAKIEDYCTNNNIELDETTIDEATEDLLYKMLDYSAEDDIAEIMEKYVD